MNNAEFIDRLRKRDPVAARHLNECFVPSIWRFVFFRVHRDPHLTEDIVAETVLTLVSAANAETAVAIENPSAWLRTVAMRRIQDHYRAVARVQHLIERAQQQPLGSDQQDPSVQHDQALDRQQVREAMESLPDHYRLALEWKYVDLLSVAVIAERLETTEKGAEALLFRARRALRSQLQSEHAPPPSAATAKAPAVPSQTESTAASRRADDPGAGGDPDSSQPARERSGVPADKAVRQESSIMYRLRLAREH